MKTLGCGVFRCWRWLLAVCVLSGMGTVAHAQCYNGGNLDLVFGTVSVGSSAFATGNAPFNCQSNGTTSYFKACLYVAEGPGNLSGVNPRQMTNYNSGSLAYTLYSDSSRSNVLGPQGGSYTVYEKTLMIAGSSSALVPLNFPVYGRVGPVPAGTAAGNYEAPFNGVFLFYSVNRNGTFPSSCTENTGSGNSGTVNMAFKATASVSNSCAVGVSATDLNFGSVSSLASPVDGTSTITLTCPPNTSWTLGLSYGVNASGTQRRMAGPSGSYVSYGLYRDANRTQIWDNSSNMVTGSGGSPGSVTVYGRVPAQPEASPGSYSDTVTVTLTY